LTFEMQPILDNFHEILNQNEVEKMMKEGTLKLQYNGKIKGITVQDAVFICDETQDMDYTDFLQLLTRLGKNSKMICTLSAEQIHKSIGRDSCYYVLDCLKEYEKVGWVDLIQNHRHGIINEIVEFVKTKRSV
ncbi:MAG: PhoH family protein, partial [Methanobacterium sp.]